MKKTIFVIIIIIFIIVAFNFDYLKSQMLERLYPIKYSEYVELYSDEYDVDPNLIYAIIKAESNFNASAVSSKGAMRTYAIDVFYCRRCRKNT